jgi:hypothetical protein
LLQLEVQMPDVKALKQSLCAKSFVGTSANALKTQIWAALDCHVADQGSAVALYLLLVAVQLGGPARPTVDCLPRSLAMDRRSVPIPTTARVHAGTTGPFSGME